MSIRWAISQLNPLAIGRGATRAKSYLQPLVEMQGVK